MWETRGRRGYKDVGGEEGALSGPPGFAGRLSHLRDRSERLLCELQRVRIIQAHHVRPRSTWELEVGGDGDHDVRVVAGEEPEKRTLSVRTQT